MKKITLFLSFCLIVLTLAQAQIPPQAFNYSAVARNGAGQPIATATVGIQINILKTSTTGPVQYCENQFVNTDAYGLFNLIIGAGAVQSGSMSAINWSGDNYYLKVGMDVNGGTNFLTMGVTQLLSVPYALHAKTADSLIGVNSGFSGNYNDLTNKPMVISPRIAAKGQKLSVSFAGGDAVTFSQASNSCPSIWASASLRLYQATTTISPFDIYYIDNKRFDVIFDIPAYIPTGFYDIILGPGTPCEQTMYYSLKIH